MSLRHPDFQLAKRMISGEETAFEEFSDNHIPALYRFALRRLHGDEELTRDMVQSTVCKAIDKLESYQGGAALMTWLCAICRTEIAGYFRKKSRNGIEMDLGDEVVESEVSLTIQKGDSPEEVTLSKESSTVVHMVLDLLPDHYSRALEWKYFEGDSVKTIAARFEIGAKAAESMLTRARQAFRDGYLELVEVEGPSSSGGTRDVHTTGAES